MELIEGKTLSLGVEIAEGLAAAHHARVIHRDLKSDDTIGRVTFRSGTGSTPPASTTLLAIEERPPHNSG